MVVRGRRFKPGEEEVRGRDGTRYKLAEGDQYNDISVYTIVDTGCAKYL